MILDKIEKDFSLNSGEVKSFISSAPNRYKVYSIKKRHGGTREIAEPTKSLKILQVWAVKNFLAKAEIHSSAIAYRKNKNIKDFASPHVNNKYMLKLDFNNFFNSIKEIDFKIFCKERLPELEDKTIDILAKILFCKDKKNKELYLSIGAPSSPFISNIIMFEFDEKISYFCNKNKIIYTRYADDLAFSTSAPNKLKLLIPKIKDICSTLNFPRNLKLNEEKTIFTSHKYNRTLTGLVLSNEGRISIGRKKKRILRAEAHKAGLGLLDDEKLEKLQGKVAFLMSIDPQFAELLKKKANL
ncbi:Retron-type reverse transcriptase [uncultured Avibacterium sp.]|uniref:RNA-directed DNA polymerase n=1 Tax=uncultured Avibacterium sp. TaxID=1936169 RepID=A0A486XGL3_9PAST|nr:Retron-type reverse transcriptase [uncultured Avibacterium sp.]